MTWVEVRYREVLDESLFGAWVLAPRARDGVRDLVIPEAVRGASYEVETRRVDDQTSRTSPWAPLGTVVVLEPLDRPSAVPGIRVECGEQLVWDPSPDGLAALYEIRTAPGDYRNFADMQPVHTVTVPGPPFPMCSIPKGHRTIAVRPLSPEGVAGDPTFAQFHLGDYDEREAVDLRRVAIAPGFVTDQVARPGVVVTIEKGTIDLGVLKAVSLGQPSWTGDAAPAWLDDAASAGWPANIYDEVRLVVSFDPAAAASGGYDFDREGVVISVDPTILAGENWRAEYRLYEAPGWSGNDTDAAWQAQDNSIAWHGADDSSPAWGHASQPTWGADDFGPAWDQYPWKPWPGRLRLTEAQRVDIRIVIPGGPIRAQLGDLVIRESRPQRVGEELAAQEHTHEVAEVEGALSAEEIEALVDEALGSGSWQTLVKPTDQAAIGDTAVDVSGLSVAVLAGQTIRFRAYLRYTTQDVNTGGMFAVNGPAASRVTYSVKEWISATGIANATHETLDEFAARTAGPGATEAIGVIEGVITFTANGTFTVRAKAEALLTMDVLAGSWLEYRTEI